MNLVFLVANLACGGVERTVSYLSRYFAEQGENTSVICISDEQFYAIDERVNLIKPNISSAASGRLDRYKKIVERFCKIRRALRQTKPDCVICLDAQMLRFIRLQYKFGHFKLVTSERTNPLMNTEKQRAAKFAAYRQSDGIVFQTARARDCFPPDIAEKGIVIPNAVGNEYVFKAQTPAVRRPAVTAVGRLSAQKDYPTLLRAFRRVHAAHPEVVLEIFGGGEDREALCALADTLGLADAVQFKGAVKDAVLQVASSACYVMSSTYEGMPNALMEALAVGTPCVSTDCPFGPAELIRSGENGLLVPVGDEEALADAICRMLDDPQFAAQCGAAGRAILEEQSIERISRQYLDYILHIAKAQ